MQDKEEFMNGLVDLLEIAGTNDNKLSMKDIKDYFSDLELDDTKIELICQYFEGNKVTIENHTRVHSMETEVDDDMDDMNSQTLAFYLEELEFVKPYTSKEEDELINRMLNGDVQARNLLTEAYLKMVIQIARTFQNKGVLVTDLIQEGNLGLVSALVAYKKEEHKNLKEYLRVSIIECMKEAMGEQSISRETALKVADRVNQLSEISLALAKSLGREATPLELAQKMGIAEEEVKDIMKISLDAISIIENT